MRFTVESTLAMLATGTAVAAQACNANNCARAVTGTREKPWSLESRRADCSKLLLVTVTPATVTTTTTITATVSTTTTSTTTSTSTTTTTGILDRRFATAIPSFVPVYASACPNVAAYRSACSCWGIRAATTTLGAPSATASATSTATVTVTATETRVAVQTDVAKVCAAPAALCDFNRPDRCCTQACCTINGAEPRCIDEQGNCFTSGPSRRWVLRRSAPDPAAGARWSRMRPDGTVEYHGFQ